MEEIRIVGYSDEEPMPRAGMVCGVLCISGILVC